MMFISLITTDLKIVMLVLSILVIDAHALFVCCIDLKSSKKNNNNAYQT